MKLLRQMTNLFAMSSCSRLCQPPRRPADLLAGRVLAQQEIYGGGEKPELSGAELTRIPGGEVRLPILRGRCELVLHRTLRSMSGLLAGILLRGLRVLAFGRILIQKAFSEIDETNEGHTSPPNIN